MSALKTGANGCSRFWMHPLGSVKSTKGWLVLMGEKGTGDGEIRADHVVS